VHFDDVFFASGAEIHTFGLHGEETATTTGAGFRFDAVLHVVLDPGSNPKVDVGEWSAGRRGPEPES